MSLCKSWFSQTTPSPVSTTNPANYSIENEGSLRAKVDEALAVYDDYVRAQGGEAGDAPGLGKDDKADGKA